MNKVKSPKDVVELISKGFEATEVGELGNMEVPNSAIMDYLNEGLSKDKIMDLFRSATEQQAKTQKKGKNGEKEETKELARKFISSGAIASEVNFGGLQGIKLSDWTPKAEEGKKTLPIPCLTAGFGASKLFVPLGTSDGLNMDEVVSIMDKRAKQFNEYATACEAVKEWAEKRATKEQPKTQEEPAPAQ